MPLPRFAAPAVLVLAACGSILPSQQSERLGLDDRNWHPSGSLTVPRASPDVVTLPDGRVLVLGGLQSVPTPVEAFDPSTGKWKTWGDAFQRTEAPVVLLDGRVLVTNERAPKLLDTLRRTTSARPVPSSTSERRTTRPCCTMGGCWWLEAGSATCRRRAASSTTLRATPGAASRR